MKNTMQDLNAKYVGDVATVVLMGFHSGTKYVSEKCVVKATARGRHNVGPRHVEMVVTIGRPNHGERLFVKRCVKAGVPFPVKKIQFAAWPAKRKAVKK